jgi:hypothetical protein
VATNVQHNCILLPEYMPAMSPNNRSTNSHIAGGVA